MAPTPRSAADAGVAPGTAELPAAAPVVAVVAQAGGTDSRPAAPACPRLADTGAPPNAPRPPKPPRPAEPSAAIGVTAADVSPPEPEPSADPALLPRLLKKPSAVDSVLATFHAPVFTRPLTLSAMPSACSGDASPCSTVGSVESSCVVWLLPVA